MTTIAAINFHFQMQSEAFARNLYGRWDHFFAHCVESVADKILNKLNTAGDEIEINKLELNLGSMLEEEFDEQFPIRFREELEEAIRKCLYDGNVGIQQNGLKRISQKENVFQLFCQFLLHGTLPWNVSGEDRNIQKLFLKVLQENAKELQQFLQQYGHYTSLQQRLVYQLNDPELEKGVHLLMPEAGNFIVGYVHLLHKKYKETRQPETTESNYRNAVWSVIYAYLLTHHSSYFDKKSFLTQTILQLASKYNITYDSLLTLLTQELKTYQKIHAIPLELFRILTALQKELSEKQLQESFVDAAKFYKTIYRSLKKELDTQVSETSRERLIHILSNPSSCRQFLRHLSEPEIIRLVPVVVPQDSSFVLEVAHALEQQKETGDLQGKTGGEFRLLKWQVIFPVLLEKRGTRFNRKEFARSVMQQIAAHYNLNYSSLLEYIIQDSKLLARIDKELKSILAELYEEFVPESSVHLKEKTITQKEPLDWTLQSIDSSKKWTLKQIKQVLQLLSDNNFQKKFFIRTNETERIRLIRFVWPQEQEFIIPYLKSLDKLHEHNQLERKSGGNFTDIKWMFLFSVLSQMPETGFNRRIFVGRVLQQIAAHYNLNYFDLLLYFHQEKINAHLPFHLEQVLNELYQEEKGHWLEILSIRTQKEKQILEQLTTQSGFLSYIECCLPVLSELKKFIRKEFNRSWNNLSILKFLLQLSENHTTLSRIEILSRIVRFLETSFNFTPLQREKWNKQLKEQAKSTIFLSELLKKEEKKSDSVNSSPKTNESTESESEDRNPIYINNAGLILLAPYLPRLFNMLHLTDNEKFEDQESQIRAIYIIQYIVFGSTDFPEYELVLNKMLTGFKTGNPIPRNIDLTEKEINAIDSMLQAILQHWKKLKNTSVAGLREGFLQREGKLEEKEDYYELTVEEKAYDILLDSVPWSFRSVKYRWMEKGIQVKWR
ncbi:MAG: hypothetical protein LBJ72_07955 [Dysgonamonadaceae bacterium]|jgi:hypothetical protein|nr:hypothetical protein [Dysgonamonadaceae bacterium]